MTLPEINFLNLHFRSVKHFFHTSCSINFNGLAATKTFQFFRLFALDPTVPRFLAKRLS